MADLVTIFKPSTLDYTDYGYRKPIKYTEKFLQEIADKTDAVLLNEEHTSKIIGSLNNLQFVDGELKCNVSDGVDVSGLGISPKFEFDLIEYDDYFEAVNGGLINAGLTANPRSHIVCNSIEEDNNMTDKLLERTLARNEELERALAKKDNELEQLKEKISGFDDLQKTVMKLEKENKKFAENHEILEEKAKAYDDNVAQKKQELINKIADGDEEMQKRLENHSLQQLTDVFDIYTKNNEPKGVGTGDDGIKKYQNQAQNRSKEEESIEDVKELYETVFGKELTFDL